MTMAELVKHQRLEIDRLRERIEALETALRKLVELVERIEKSTNDGK